MGIKIISESADEPISLDEAAGNLRLFVDGNSPPGWVEGTRVTKLIKAARQTCEQELEVSLVIKTIELALDRFPRDEIELPQPPVQSITSVKYIDSDGTEQTLAADQYVLDTYQLAGWLLPAVDTSWPTTKAVINAVKVRYVAGFPSADSPSQEVPEPIRQAMHLYIFHYFENRQAVDADTLSELPMGVRSLLSHYRRGLGV